MSGSMRNNNNDLRERWELNKQEDDDNSESENEQSLQTSLENLTLEQIKRARLTGEIKLEDVKVKQKELGLRHNDMSRSAFSRQNEKLAKQYDAVRNELLLLDKEVSRRKVAALQQSLRSSDNNDSNMASVVPVVDQKAMLIERLQLAIARRNAQITLSRTIIDALQKQLAERSGLTAHETRFLELLRLGDWGNLLRLLGSHINKVEIDNRISSMPDALPPLASGAE